ncbi:MAG: hypothetical protein JWR14_3183 [Caballeronia sp.]|nr:hypothetical protein [Caballeronia sp.]
MERRMAGCMLLPQNPISHGIPAKANITGLSSNVETD